MLTNTTKRRVFNVVSAMLLTLPSPARAQLRDCVCHGSYDWTSFGVTCEEHCMAIAGDAYCHPGAGSSMFPCARMGCNDGEERCIMVRIPW